MEKFDVLIIGSGSGASIADAAISQGLKVALVEKGDLGGTCLNRGCIPSKMVIYPADIIQTIKHAERLGIKAVIEEIDFSGIMDRMRRSVGEDRRHIEAGVAKIKGLKFFKGSAEFTGEYRIRVGAEEMEAKNIFLVVGARPEIPDIIGLDKVSYLTSENVWELHEKPTSMVIAGGGFIAAEMAHFFSSMGTDVTVISRSPRLLRHAEPEISETLTQSMRTRMTVITSAEMTNVREAKGLKEVTYQDEKGVSQTVKAEQLLIATGLRGNGDTLHAELTGVKVDPKGYIKVNDAFETGKPRIWAFGDCIGKAMFKHVANQAAEVVWHAFSHGHVHNFDFSKVPYAVFSWPEVASVGLTEEEALKQGKKILVGEAAYADTAYGASMGEEDGFCKLIVEQENNKILGCHILGPYAPILIQEVVNCMSCGDGGVFPLMDSMHIHPALPEVVQRATFTLHEHGSGHVHQH
jgi:mycothione reductase